MRLHQMSSTYFLDRDYDRSRILVKLGLITWLGKRKIALEILEQLSRRKANVYELKWKRMRGIDAHYSTVLRALRRLEEKKLVRIVSSSKVGRRKKIYACTLLGELAIVLARDGLRAVAQIVAESSPSFRECLGVHLSFDPHYYVYLTRGVIWEILGNKRGEMVTRPDLDAYVRKIELRWFSENIIEELNNLSSRPKILKYLRKITHIDWISDWVMHAIERYAEMESEWLQTLKDFEREVKRARVFSGNIGQTL